MSAYDTYGGGGLSHYCKLCNSMDTTKNCFHYMWLSLSVWNFSGHCRTLQKSTKEERSFLGKGFRLESQFRLQLFLIPIGHVWITCQATYCEMRVKSIEFCAVLVTLYLWLRAGQVRMVTCSRACPNMCPHCICCVFVFIWREGGVLGQTKNTKWTFFVLWTSAKFCDDPSACAIVESAWQAE